MVGELGVQRDMPLYQSHKKVRALEIKAIGERRMSEDMGGFERTLEFAEPGYDPLRVPTDMFARYTPVPGDFYVVYEDDYKSFSPRKAFLDGYTPAPEKA